MSSTDERSARRVPIAADDRRLRALVIDKPGRFDDLFAAVTRAQTGPRERPEVARAAS